MQQGEEKRQQNNMLWIGSFLESIGGGYLALFVVVMVCLHVCAFMYWLYRVATEDSRRVKNL